MVRPSARSSGMKAGSYPKPPLPLGSDATVPPRAQRPSTSMAMALTGSTTDTAHTYVRPVPAGASVSSLARFSSSLAVRPA